MAWNRVRPWMQPQDDETRKQQLDRVSRSCYRCGTVIKDQQALADHEDACEV